MDRTQISQLDTENEERFVICATAGGRILYVTGELIYYIGQNPTGRNLNDLIPDEHAAEVIAHARHGEPYRFECTIDKCLFSCESRRAGEEINLTMFPVNDPREVFINKNAAELIAGEMNDSLHLMRLHLNHMAKRQEGEGADMTAILNQQIYRLTRLARNMYDCAMWVNGSLRLNRGLHDMTRICGELVDELRPLMEAAGISFTAKLPEEPLECYVDKQSVQRMILNLIANSMKALENNRIIQLALGASGESFSITVTDYGRGSDMDEVFSKNAEIDPGDMTGWKGAGFGIFLVRAYAKSHGGAFMITSRPGGRTVARITLPKGRGEDSGVVGTLIPEYGNGGAGLILTELSTALGKEHYAISPKKSARTKENR